MPNNMTASQYRELWPLLELSARIGNDPLLAQASTGNASMPFTTKAPGCRGSSPIYLAWRELTQDNIRSIGPIVFSDSWWKNAFAH